MTNPTPNSLSPQGEHAPGPAPLSPAAQAVLDAFLNCSLNSRQWHDGMGPQLKIAAAIRAVAHHLQRCSPWLNDDPASIFVDWCTSELHDIASELETFNG